MSEFEIDHIGVAVDELSAGGKFYEILGLKRDHVEDVPSEKVKTAFYPLGNQCNIELLQSTDQDSAIAKFIEKRGAGIHHICLRVKNIREVLARLKKHGIKLINEEPKKGAHNCLIAFVHPKSTGGVLIELSEPQGDR